MERNRQTANPSVTAECWRFDFLESPNNRPLRYFFPSLFSSSTSSSISFTVISPESTSVFISSEAFAAAVRSLDDTARLAEVVAAGTAHIARVDWAHSAGVLLDAVRKASRRRT